MFGKLQWLSFPKLIKYHTSLMVYKTLNGLAPKYLQNLFTKTSEMHSRNLRSVENDDLRVPFARTNYLLKSFSVEGSKQRNSLPTELRQIQTLQSFKSALKPTCLTLNLNTTPLRITTGHSRNKSIKPRQKTSYNYFS